MWDLNSLRNGLDFLTSMLNSKLDDVKRINIDLSPLVRPLDMDRARSEVLSRFGPGSYKAVGIDGSMDYTIGLDVVTMFIAVASYSLEFVVDGSGEVNLSFNDVRKDDSMSIFKIIPFWFDDLSGFTGLNNLLDDRAIGRSLDSIPRSIMAFSEYYFACKALEDESTKIVFLDRPIASSLGPFKRDARELIRRYNGGIFTSKGIDGIRVGLVDLYLAVHLGPYPGFYRYEFRPGSKMHYIIQALVRLAREGGDRHVRYKELETVLPVRILKDKLVKKLDKLNREFLGGGLIEEFSVDGFILSNNVFTYWDSIEKLLETFTSHLYNVRRGSYSHPLYIEGRPLTVKEINTLGLFLIYKLKMLEESMDKLVIGIGKDTSVTDMNRSVIPYLSSRGVIPSIDIRGVKSDRSMYSILSTLHREYFPVPWRSIGYDNIFTTLVYRDGYLSPARKKATQSRFLVRNYFQLREVKSLDIYVRSPIFFYDRFYRDGVDSSYLVEEDIVHIDKSYRSKFYIEDRLNPFDNMILYILSKFDNNQIIESAGHNYLLFIADKEVKRMIQTVRNSVSSVIENTLYRMIRNYNIFIITKSFREYRAQLERGRRR